MLEGASDHTTGLTAAAEKDTATTTCSVSRMESSAKESMVPVKTTSGESKSDDCQLQQLEMDLMQIIC